MSLRDLNVRMPDGKRPYSDEDWAWIAVSRTPHEGVIRDVGPPQSITHHEWELIHELAKETVAELKEKLARWRELAEATDFAEAMEGFAPQGGSRADGCLAGDQE